MTFLAPLAWSFLALGLPIIAFYLIRTRLERRGVSTLLFWEQIKTQSYNSALWRKLRRWLSLLLQLLILLLVVLALARPLPPWQSAKPGYLVFILDPSASMSAREGKSTRWQVALDQLKHRLNQMRAFDRAALLVAGEPPVVLSGWSASKRSLLEALNAAHPSEQPVPLRPALALAENLKSTQPGAEVMLFTDGVWSDLSETPKDVKVQWIGEAQPNVAITHFSARRSFSSPEQVRLAGEVVAYGKDAEGTAELYRDGVLVDAQPLTLKVSVPWHKEWDLRTREAARYELKLTGFPADALPLDDTAAVTVAGMSPVNVILVSDSNAYLEAALNSLPLIEWARVEKITGYPDPKALYIFNHTVPPAGFEQANCLLIDPPAEGFWGKPLNQPVDHPLVSEIAKEEPLLRHTGLQNIRLDAADAWQKPADAVIFADSFGSPLVYGQWDSRRHWALFAFDLNGSDFVLRTAFPILLGNAVESIRSSTPISPSLAPGPVESALAKTVTVEAATATESAPPASARWLVFPLWWWAILLGTIVVFVEWRLYTRRITE